MVYKLKGNTKILINIIYNIYDIWYIYDITLLMIPNLQSADISVFFLCIYLF